MERRVALTDFQKIIVYLAVVVAVFGAAMTLGTWSVWPLIAGATVLAAVLIGAFAIQVRRATAGAQIVTARVISASPAPANAGIAAACTMKVAVLLPGRGRVETRLKDPAVPLSRWPSPGSAYPVEVLRGNPHRRLRIRWDLVEAGIAGPFGVTPGAPQGVIWENDERPIVYSPTPPRQRRRAGARPAPYAPQAPQAPQAQQAPPAPPPDPVLHEDFAEFEDEFTGAGEQTVRTSPSRLDDPREGKPNGHDPDGYDPADFEAPRLQAIPLPDFDPADIDTRDFDVDAPAVTYPPPDVTDARHEEGWTAPTIPQPRDAGATPSGGRGIEFALPVADLARSLRFYREALGFTLADSGRDSAVVESGRTRILLRSVATGDVPAATVHVEVGDIEAACAQLLARGIAILQAPVATGGSDGPQLWRARVRDPDGHDVELVEFRQRG